MHKFDLHRVKLCSKEGLALINGTQFVTALGIQFAFLLSLQIDYLFDFPLTGAEAVVRACNVTRTADVISALSLEALKGTHRAFDERIHKVNILFLYRVLGF